MNFKLRCNDMEVRSCNKRLLDDGEHTTAEIIYWFDVDGEQRCYAIAYWIRGGEGYYLKFVGDRPLDHFECWGDFGDLVNCGQRDLNKYFVEGNGGRTLNEKENISIHIRWCISFNSIIRMFSKTRNKIG